MLQYERELNKLEEGIQRGEIKGELAVHNEHLAILEKASQNMSTEEVEVFLARTLSVHTAAADDIAAEGGPVPGNNSSRPN